jgi:hypothetical protein
MKQKDYYREALQQELEVALIVRDRIEERIESLKQIQILNRQRIAELRLKIEESKNEKPVNS